MAFSRRGRGFFAMNNEKSTDLQRTIRAALPPGDYCDIITGDLIGK